MREKFAKAVMYNLGIVPDKKEALQKQLENLDVFNSINKMTDEMEAEFIAGDTKLNLWKNEYRIEISEVKTGDKKNTKHVLIWEQGRTEILWDVLHKTINEYIEHMRDYLSSFRKLTFLEIKTIGDVFQALSLASEFPELRFLQRTSKGKSYWKGVELTPEELEVYTDAHGWVDAFEKAGELITYLLNIKVPSVQDVFGDGITLDKVVKFFLSFAIDVYINPFLGSNRAARVSIECESSECYIRAGRWFCSKDRADNVLKKILKVKNWEELSGPKGFYIMGEFTDGSTIIVEKNSVRLTIR